MNPSFKSGDFNGSTNFVTSKFPILDIPASYSLVSSIKVINSYFEEFEWVRDLELEV